MWRDLRFLKSFTSKIPPRVPTVPRSPVATEPSAVLALHEVPDQLLRRLNWSLLRPLASYLGGSERSQFLGPGVEFSEIRAYQPGDDIRFIDWNISARMEQPMVREAHVERAIDVWFLLDMSASIHWGTATCLKRDRAIEFTAIAGQLLNRVGNRLGALLFAEQPFALLPPQVGRLHLIHLLTQLCAQKNSEPSEKLGSTDLTSVLARAHTVIRRRSLILIISDFLVADGWQVPLGKLAQRHEIVAVRLNDPRESELPDVGLVTLEDPETGRQLLVNTSDLQVRTRFMQAAKQQQAQIQADLTRCGAEILQLRTDEDIIATMVRFLQTRRARKIQRVASAGVRATSSRLGKGEVL